MWGILYTFTTNSTISHCNVNISASILLLAQPLIQTFDCGLFSKNQPINDWTHFSHITKDYLCQERKPDLFSSETGQTHRRVCPWWAARHGKVKVPILLPELSDLLLHVFRELPRKKSKGNENAEIRSADCCDY